MSADPKHCFLLNWSKKKRRTKGCKNWYAQYTTSFWSYFSDTMRRGARTRYGQVRYRYRLSFVNNIYRNYVFQNRMWRSSDNYLCTKSSIFWWRHIKKVRLFTLMLLCFTPGLAIWAVRPVYRYTLTATYRTSQNLLLLRNKMQIVDT